MEQLNYLDKMGKDMHFHGIIKVKSGIKLDKL